jgi:hypothetical protein
MAGATELAQSLVAYDRRAAETMLRATLAELGQPPADGELDADAARVALEQLPVGPRLARISDVRDAPATTEEWKTELRHETRLRELGLELARALSG